MMPRTTASIRYKFNEIRFLERKSGFTLIEMLVALVILAVASVAIYGRAGQSVSQLYSLEQRTIANWIAQDHITKLRIGRRNTTEPIAAGTEREEVYAASRLWDLRVETTETDHPWMHRVEVYVAPVTEAGVADPVHTSTAFIGRY
ncbi:MAG: type II secretion system minor pseudopilin GspI [Pseudomonadota bacterium]